MATWQMATGSYTKRGKTLYHWRVVNPYVAAKCSRDGVPVRLGNNKRVVDILDNNNLTASAETS